MKNNLRFLVALIALASCQPVSDSSTTAALDTPVKLDVVVDKPSTFGDVTVSAGEINKARAAIFEFKSQQKTIGLIQLGTAQNGTDAAAQCASLGGNWRILNDVDFLTLLMTGNLGGVYNSMMPIPGIEATLVFPAWVEGSQDKNVQLLMLVDGAGSELMNFEGFGSRFGSEKAITFRTVALQKTTVYCINGQLK